MFKIFYGEAAWLSAPEPPGADTRVRPYWAYQWHRLSSLCRRRLMAGQARPFFFSIITEDQRPYFFSTRCITAFSSTGQAMVASHRTSAKRPPSSGAVNFPQETPSL